MNFEYFIFRGNESVNVITIVSVEKKMSIEIRIAAETVNSDEDDVVEETEFSRNRFFSPGDVITR